MASSVDCQRSFLSCSGLYKSYHKAMVSFSLRLTQFFSFLRILLGNQKVENFSSLSVQIKLPEFMRLGEGLDTRYEHV